MSTLPSFSSGTNFASDITSFPSTSSFSPVALSISVPFTVYSWPMTSPSYFTVSTMVTSPAATASWLPVSASAAVVPISGLGNSTVWSSSPVSSCERISTPRTYAFSNTTIFLSSNSLPSNVKTTSTLPLPSFGTNFVSAVTSSPFTRNGSPVRASISLPRTVYSSPGCRSSNATVSMMVTSSPGTPSCVPVSADTAVVPMSFVLVFSITRMPTSLPSIRPSSSTVNSCTVSSSTYPGSVSTSRTKYVPGAR